MKIQLVSGLEEIDILNEFTFAIDWLSTAMPTTPSHRAHAHTTHSVSTCERCARKKVAAAAATAVDRKIHAV